MKTLLSFGVVVLLVGMSALAQSGSENPADIESVRNHLIGAWRLAWLEEPGADGKVHRTECTGLLVYTSDGHMSVQVMYRSPQGASSAAPVQYAQGGYEASFGTYRIDERSHTFVFHVEGALVRTLVGQDLKRAYELSGNQLIVKPSDTSERWRVAWERY